MNKTFNQTSRFFLCLSLLAGASGCSQKTAPSSQSESFSSGNPSQVSSISEAKPSLDEFFPEDDDPSALSEGMTKISSQWKARHDLPIYQNQDSISKQTADGGTIQSGESFRVFRIQTYPFGEYNDGTLYGFLADGSGYVPLFDEISDDHVQAGFLSGMDWPIPQGVRLISGTAYRQPDQSAFTTTMDTMILVNLVKGNHDIPWAETMDGYFPLYQDGHLNFYNPIDGIVRPLTDRSAPRSHFYRSIISSKTFANQVEETSLFWGSALADLDQDGTDELLLMQGGLNEDLRLSIYGVGENLYSEQPDLVFPFVCSFLWQDENGSLLRFQNEQGKRSVTRIQAEKGEVTLEKLSESELSSLDLSALKRIEFKDIYDYSDLDALEKKESSNENKTSSASDESSAPSEQTEWKLNYNMNVREKPDRTSESLETLPKGDTVHLREIRQIGSETWGLLYYRGWICLRDKEFEYVTPLS